ncbi:DinB family protein [bacterium]|nr:DinB family protein [bacterium]
MPSMFEPFVQELDREVATTRRFLERIPADKLDWRPHEKSMSLGQLALHVAAIPSVDGALGCRGYFRFQRCQF